VFLAEVGDAGCAGFEDPQAEQAQKRDQCEVVRVGRQPGGGDQGLELATSADPRESRHLPQDLNRDAATHVVAAKNEQRHFVLGLGCGSKKLIEVSTYMLWGQISRFKPRCPLRCCFRRIEGGFGEHVTWRNRHSRIIHEGLDTYKFGSCRVTLFDDGV
jgi:hypothetical protein